MIYKVPPRSRARRFGVASGLIGTLLTVVGCSTWKMERVNVFSEAKSSGTIGLTAPRVYQDREGILLAGELFSRGIGAHHPGPSHLHAQTIDGEGRVISDSMTAAPYIRHDHFSSRESATYTVRLKWLPPSGGRFRVILHRFSMRKCT